MESGVRLQRFPTRKLTEGRYSLRLNSLDEVPFFLSSYIWQTEFDVDRDGEYPFHVPPPMELRVTVRDADSGALLPEAQVSWSPPMGDLKHGGSVGAIAAEPPGSFVVRAPVGPIEVHGSLDGYFPASVAHELGTDGPEVSVLLNRNQGVSFVFSADGATLSTQELNPRISLAPESAAAGDPGVPIQYRMADGERTYMPRDPGRYRVTVRDIDGYASLEPFVIEIPKGEIIEVGIDLTPKR